MATIGDLKRAARKVKQAQAAAQLIPADLVATANDDGVTAVKVTNSLDQKVDVLRCRLRVRIQRIPF